MAFGVWMATDKAELADFAMSLKYRHGNGTGDVVLRAVGFPPTQLYHVLLETGGVRIERDEVVNGELVKKELGRTAECRLKPGSWHDLAVRLVRGNLDVTGTDGRTKYAVAVTDPQALKGGVVCLGSLFGNGFAYDEVTMAPLRKP